MTTGSTPSKDELIELAKGDIAKFNELRRDNPRLSIDLSDADLEGAALKGANLSSVKLKNADLKGADLTNSNMHRADLEGADLQGAKLGAYVGETCMRFCLHENSFKGAHFDKSQLEEILSIINLNGDWEVKYEIVPKK